MSFFDLFRHNDETEEYTPFASDFRRILNDLSDNAEEDKEQYPEDADEIDSVLKVLRRQCKNRYAGRRGGEHSQPLDAEARFFLSENRMKAYACLLPPDNGGLDIDMERFLSDMRYEGVCYGLLQKQAQQYVSERMYLHIFPVARGTWPQNGKDGQVQELFQRRKTVHLEVASDSVIDFDAYEQMQAIRKGDVICKIKPPVQGVDGTDVTGVTRPCRQAAPLHVPAGRNTKITKDGRSLVAAIDGVLFTKNDLFYVQQQKVISGNLDSFEGILRISGDLSITGDVAGGVQVEVSGNMMVYGEIRDARITCAGTIRIQKGIRGVQGETFLKVGRQLQASTIVSATIEVEGDLIAEVVQDCQVHCSGVVNVKGGRGLIVGGSIQSDTIIVCKRIGNLSGKKNYLFVGCSPTLLIRQNVLKNEISSVQSTLEKLRKNIGILRMAGSHISLEKRNILAQLLEQRRLYEEKGSQLQEELKQVKELLKKATDTGRIQCQELYPLTVVQIGKQKGTFQFAETNCNIHYYGGQIVVR